MIKKVLIVGLGGIGALYASMIKHEVKVLVDKKRMDFYKNNPTIINDVEHSFDFISKNENYKPDLIIIATKFNHLNSVLDNIEPFIYSGVKILSLLNGISSERIISERFSDADVIKSFVICNSVIRTERKITHDGVNKIVIDSDKDVVRFFENNNINYETSSDIKSSMWEKFMLNIVANQLSAVTRMNFGQMNGLACIDKLLNNILEEVIQIAELEKISDSQKLALNAIRVFKNMAEYGKTSMLQDIEANIETEIEAFAGEIITLGKKHKINTPYNNLFYYLIK